MTPAALFSILIFLTTIGVVAQIFFDRRRRQRLRALATEWRMHFVRDDRFHLAERIAPALPVPGAAGVLVKDLIYGIEGEANRYFLTVEYTIGVISGRRRVRNVFTCREPRHLPTDVANPPHMEMASADLKLIEQYERLHASTRPEEALP